ncbi:hypothetical protein [Aquabacterium sp.]|nr:hypothetical protein [Aquabacterium sp.]HSW04040.1 hypothetical protein [Aquabacterium sp.]
MSEAGFGPADSHRNLAHKTVNDIYANWLERSVIHYASPVMA